MIKLESGIVHFSIIGEMLLHLVVYQRQTHFLTLSLVLPMEACPISDLLIVFRLLLLVEEQLR